MNIAFFTSSLAYACWNGASTYYRSIGRALGDRGHNVTFLEAPTPGHASPPGSVEALEDLVERGRGADLVINASGGRAGGAHDPLLDALVLELQGPRALVVFWDVDPPATLNRIEGNPDDPFRALVRRYDLVFTYGGGAPVIDTYLQLGAQYCVPIYNALDPLMHHRVTPAPRFEAALGFLGNRLTDRERRVDELLLGAARRLPDHRIVLGGAGWRDKPLPGNVAYLGHVFASDHNAFHTTPRAILHLSREPVASYGCAPPARLFEAAGAGACVISDPWIGIEQFLEPGREVLVARTGEDVASYVASLDPELSRSIGERAQARMLDEHTFAHRALEIEVAIGELPRVRANRWIASRHQPRALRVVVLGLSITSSWDNPHAATYRSLLRALAERGHEVTFLERDEPRFAPHRDLTELTYARVALYAQLDELHRRFSGAVRDADLVIVGSGVADGIAVGRWVTATARGVAAFYDLDPSVTLARIEAGDCPYLDRELIARYAMYLSLSGGPVLGWIEGALGARRALPLYGSVDPAMYGPELRTMRWDVGCIGAHCTDRQLALQRFLIEPARREPTRRFAVAGLHDPPALEWAPNIERLGHVRPERERALYNEMSFNLHVSCPGMQATGWSPSQRLFEAAACAAPIISDAWRGLDELFEPGHEILVAHDGDDVLRFLRDLGDAERRAIGARGCVRVHNSHTAAHRAADLERYVRELA
jgi:spore maturation protein CgeB